MIVPHIVYILFAFALGACVGSFLNVVVHRLPSAETWWQGIRRLVHPPSHCPKCNTELAWKDNIPIFGWILLRGQCRYCQAPISPRYPIVEAATGLLFALYYIAFFLWGWGPCVAPTTSEWGVIAQPQTMQVLRDWPIYGLYIFTIAALLAASLIDAELFIIPLEIPWTMAAAGVVVHALVADQSMPGNLIASPLTAAIGAGGTVGLVISGVLLLMGWLPRSFPKGEPMQDVDRAALAAEIEALRQAGKPAPELPPTYTRRQIRQEMSKEMLFLLPPMLLAGLMIFLTSSGGAVQQWWQQVLQADWLAGLLGALNGALIGALVVWVTRILGTLAFGRLAMGLGDVHLMFGVGAIIGGLGATIAFFIAPFFGIVLAVWMLMTRKGRELPFGPYLSMGTACVMLFYCPLTGYVRRGLEDMLYVLGAGIQ